MTRTTNASIKRELTLINLLTAGVMLFLLCGGLTVYEFLSFRKTSIDSLTVQAKMIGGNSAAALTFNDPAAAGEILSTMSVSPNIVRAAIYAWDGGIFATYRRSAEDVSAAWPPPMKERSHLGLYYLDIAQPILLEGKTIGTIYIRSDLKALYSHLLIYSGTIGLIMSVSLLAGFLLLSRLQEAITRPILGLTALMRGISTEKDYSRRAEARGVYEFCTLAEGFNGMLEQIQRRDGELELSRKNLAAANEGLHTELLKRRRAEDDLQRLNRELESRVKERTAQLIDAQEELVRKEKLSVLGTIAGSVGHEIRNPLGVISNAVFYLKTIHADADETTKEYLDIIMKEVAESERIVADLLDFARTKPPQKQRVKVVDLITQSLEKCKVSGDITVETELPETLPEVSADPLQMRQVFVNIVKNAVEAMPKGGTVWIRAAQDRGAGLLRVSFTDTGPGIPPESINKLFQPLFTTKAKGLGFGLTIVKNLTEANGGRIEAKSEPGKGTTFSVLLPAYGEN